jgi:glutathione S-transferase
MTELMGISFSPWSEKARWALDVRRVPYNYRPYQPLLGEPALRWKLGRLTGRVTVPVLTTDDGSVLGDSAEIARWADQHGEGPRLFPSEHEAKIAHFIDLSERGLSAWRALSLGRVLKDDEALSEMVPGPIRRTLGGVATSIGRAGVERTLRKYYGREIDTAAHRATLAAILDEIRATLGKSSTSASPRTLLGAFTFADIAVSQVLVSVEPPSFGLKIGAASRRCFPDPELRERYADLVAWRDELYDVFRRPTVPTRSERPRSARSAAS